MDHDIRFPIGRYAPPDEFTPEVRAALIAQIEVAPTDLRRAVAGLDERQLATPYREGGWTVRQVVHHLADSHLNAYVRCKLALTEERPTVKTWEEAAWAELVDARSTDIELSLSLLAALHGRWVLCLGALEPADFARSLVHPQAGEMSLDRVIALYAWHGRHHAAHVTALRSRLGW